MADSKGLDTARDVVKSILNQITEGDAPSSNFSGQLTRHLIGGGDSNPSRLGSVDSLDGSLTASELSTSSLSSPNPRPSRLFALPPRPPLSSSAANSKRDVGAGSEQQQQPQPAIPYSVGVELLGTRSLADLCSRMLETSGSPNGLVPGDAVASDISRGQNCFVAGDVARDKSSSGRRRMFGSEYARVLSTTVLPLPPNSANVSGANKVFQKSSAVSRKLKSSLTMTPGKESVEPDTVILNIGDCSKAITTAAMTDVIVTNGDDVPPKGYYRAFQLAEEPAKSHMAHPGRKRHRLYLNVKKEPSWDRAVQRPCVTAFAVIYPDKKEFVPPGFSVVRIYRPNSNNKKNVTDAIASSSSPANINLSSPGSERVFLCYRRSREGNPVTGVACLNPAKGDVVPPGFTVLERTPRNHVANLMAAPDQLFLAYRQRLENLECLRPLPLLLSAMHAKQEPGCRKDLKAYYCTNGKTVASDIGRFHIMDRTTHSLLSTSSAQSRLNVIQSSRQESDVAVPEWAVSSTSLQRIQKSSSLDDAGSSQGSPSINNTSFDTCSSLGRTPSQGSASTLMTAASEPNTPESLQSSLDAFHFIPAIQAASDDFSQSLLHSRTTVLLPILTSCYSAQGGLALLAVEGLHSLLKDDFFAQDIVPLDTGSCSLGDVSRGSRLTLLDMAVQSACDVATTFSRETHFRAIVDFVADSVHLSRGMLNDRTLGFVLRFYLFVFYFGASIPTTGWPFNQMDSGGDFLLDSQLSEQSQSMTGRFFEGGAHQAAAVAMKGFISILLGRAGAGLEQPLLSFEEESESLSNHTQLAIYQIHRSGGSELFWHDMIHSVGRGLFGNNAGQDGGCATANTIAFAVLASIVKACSGKVRVTEDGNDPVPRDVASKLLGLDLLSHFLRMWDVAAVAETKTTVGASAQSLPENATTTMGYAIRRLVSPTILSNTSAAIEDDRVFRRIIRIVSQFCRCQFYRRQMKVEIGILFQHFILRVLAFGPQVDSVSLTSDIPPLFHQQLDVLDAIISLSNEPGLILDIFINYEEVEILPPPYLKLFHKLVETLSSLSEQCGSIVYELARLNGSPSKLTSRKEESTHFRQHRAKQLRDKTFEALATIINAIKTAAEKSGETEPAMTLIDSDNFGDGPSGLSPQLLSRAPYSGDDDNSIATYWKKTIENRKASLSTLLPTPTGAFSFEASASDDSVERPHKRNELKIALELIKSKGMKKGLDYLVACKTLTPTPKHVSTFLRVNQSSIDQAVLGDYLGEGGDGSDKDYWNLLRFHYVRATSFVGLNLEQALRLFLSNCGFRLPGEAQKVDRIVSTFSQCFWEDNAADIRNCPFQNQDTVFVVSFAIIMLNSDLHKANANGKSIKRMTKEEFVKNLRGVDDGIRKFTAYLHSIYDSIEVAPIAILEIARDKTISQSLQLDQPSESITESIQVWVRTVKPAQELLRTIATRKEELWSHTQDERLRELTTRAFSVIWPLLHYAVNSTIDNAHLDVSGLSACADLLEYALCTASILGLDVERSAFSKLLGRANRFSDHKTNFGISSVDDESRMAMQNVSKFIRNGDILLSDPTRTFVREGDLIKRHKTTTLGSGRTACYRFFLFSDVLVYGHKSSQGDYKIHEELPLKLIKITDAEGGAKQCSFRINHPNKSFTVVAANDTDKEEWIESIQRTVGLELHRISELERSRIEASRRKEV